MNKQKNRGKTGTTTKEPHTIISWLGIKIKSKHKKEPNDF